MKTILNDDDNFPVLAPDDDGQTTLPSRVYSYGFDEDDDIMSSEPTRDVSGVECKDATSSIGDSASSMMNRHTTPEYGDDVSGAAHASMRNASHIAHRGVRPPHRAAGCVAPDTSTADGGRGGTTTDGADVSARGSRVRTSSRGDRLLMNRDDVGDDDPPSSVRTREEGSRAREEGSARTREEGSRAREEGSRTREEGSARVREGRYHSLRAVEKRRSVTSDGDDLYVPYKYRVADEGGAVLIYARGVLGRKFFNIRVTDWCHLVFDDVPTDDEGAAARGDLLSVLKQELATESVTYDGELCRYTVEPGSCVTPNVRDYASSCTRVALKSFSLLSRYGHRFFDPFDASGTWRVGGEGGASSCSGAFRTMVLAQVDSKTVAYTQHGFHGVASSREEKLTVYIATLHSEISRDAVVLQAASAFPAACVGDDGVGVTLDIVVYSGYTSAAQIVDDIVSHSKRAVDIVVHYGVSDSGPSTAGPSAGRGGDITACILSKLRSENTIEVFDLCDYVRCVYPDMPVHTFSAVARDVNIESGIAECDAVAASALRALYGDASDGGVTEEMLFAEVGNALHTQENAVFFVSRVAARAFLLGMLYFSLSKSVFDLVYVSGCNMSELTRSEHTARGVMAFLDPVSAWSPIVDGLPSDSMGTGMHGLTYVTPLSHLLVNALAASECEFTRAVADTLSPLRAYGWVVRDVFNMQCVRPAPIELISPRTGAYGLFRNMLYSSVPIVGTEAASRQWSIIINVGMNSWVAINMVSGDDESVTFGYFGLHDVCRHPFSAMRMAVEMYLKMRVCMNNASVTPQSVADTVSLTRESMEMSVRVTANNVAHYRKLVSESVASKVAHGETVETLRLWYLTSDSFTTNGVRANRRVYVERICRVLRDAFMNTMRALPPPPDCSRENVATERHHATSMSARGGGVESPVGRARRALDKRATALREESTSRRGDSSPTQVNVVLPVAGARDRLSFYPKRKGR